MHTSTRMLPCPLGCCHLTMVNTPFDALPPEHRWHKYKRPKGGVLFHDTETDRVLLIQSCGQKWGPPKGTMEDTDEDIEDCAMREFHEETGLRVAKSELCNPIKMDRATYFYVHRRECDCEPVSPAHMVSNDATGWTWIKPACVKHMVASGAIDITSHCNKLLVRIEKIK